MCSRERGTVENKPHLNGHYGFRTRERDDASIRTQEKSWLRALAHAATALSVHAS